MNLLKDIENYWDRSSSFSNYNSGEFNDFKKETYCEILKLNLGDIVGERGLDIGCGPGFFSCILASEGVYLNSVDYRLQMLQEAKQNFSKYFSEYRGEKIAILQKMYAQKLEFSNNEFDFIVSRNLTWNLQNPAKAYAQWLLKPSRTLLIFDDKWYGCIYDEEIAALTNRGYLIANGYKDIINSHSYYKASTIENIPKDLFFTKIKRPAWDSAYFQYLGLRVVIDNDLSSRVFSSFKKVLYQYSLPFLVTK